MIHRKLLRLFIRWMRTLAGAGLAHTGGNHEVVADVLHQEEVRADKRRKITR